MDVRMQMTAAVEEFKKNVIKEGMRKIYSEIYAEVKNVSPEQLAARITSSESTKVNAFLFKVDQKMGAFAAEELKKAGVPALSIPFIWPEIRRGMGLPQIKLCNQNPTTANLAPKANAGYKCRMEDAAPDFKWGKWVLIAGVAVEVVGWIFIPALTVWRPIIKGIGLLAMGVGGVKMYNEKTVKARIVLTPKAVEANQMKAREQILDLCRQQGRMNEQILLKWADQMAEQLIAEAEKALAGE